MHSVQIQGMITRVKWQNKPNKGPTVFEKNTNSVFQSVNLLHSHALLLSGKYFTLPLNIALAANSRLYIEHPVTYLQEKLANVFSLVTLKLNNLSVFRMFNHSTITGKFLEKYINSQHNRVKYDEVLFSPKDEN